MSETITSEWLASFRTSDRQMKHPETRRAQTIAFTGGKGGVGKTSLALKFAKELAREGHKTLLVDCDYNLSNTAIKLGLPLNDKFYDLISLKKSFDDCLYVDGLFHLLSGCNGHDVLVGQNFKIDDFFYQVVKEHEKHFDYILVDSPAGLDKRILNINAYCQHRVVVLTPDKSSITDAYSLVKILKTNYGVSENHILINKVSQKEQFCRVVKTFSETAEQYLNCRTRVLGGVKNLQVLPDDFDRIFLEDENSAAHKSIHKAVKRFTEKLVEGARTSSQLSHSSKEKLAKESPTCPQSALN